MIGCVFKGRLSFTGPGDGVLCHHDGDVVLAAVTKCRLGERDGCDVGLGVLDEAAGDPVVLDHVAQAVATENDAVPVLELQPAARRP